MKLNTSLSSASLNFPFAYPLILCLAFASLLCGCRTAPDIRSFTDATSQLAGSIKSTGRMVAGEIDVMSSKWPADQHAAAKKTADQFTREWTQRNALADALLEYSASLTAIVQAGEQGEASAKALSESFKKLCGAVEIAMPPAAGVEAVVNIGAQLYGRFARNYAAKTLGDGMKQLQPTIDETVLEISHSLQQIEKGLDAIRDQSSQNIEDEQINGIKVTTKRGKLEELSRRRFTLLKILSDGNITNDLLRIEILRSPTDANDKAFARIASLNADIRAELATVEASLKAQSEELAPVNARKAAEYTRLTTEILLVRTVRAGLGDWAAVHSRLAAAALEKKPLQVDDLVQTTLEIRDMVKTIRTVNKE